MIYKIKNIDKFTTIKSTVDKNTIIKMHNEINLISENINNSIVNIYGKSEKKYIEKKTTIKDGLNFNLYNALLNSTHDNTTSYLNYKKKSSISRQAYENRSSSFDHDKLKIINDNLFVNNKTKKNINKDSFISNNKTNIEKFNSIDGTSINIYDVNEKLKYKQINMLGLTNNNNSLLFSNKVSEEKQSEIGLFYELIKQYSFEKNEIIVVDKLYFSKKFIETCKDKDLKFIARIKSNSIALNKFKDFINNPGKKFNYNPLSYTVNYHGTKIKVVSFMNKNEYINIATNIYKKKSIDYFKEKYGDRWNIEIFFKHVKKNSSITKITSHDLKTINNVILSASINQIIIDRILSVYNHFNTNKKKTINITNFYDLYKSHLMYEIINNILSFDEFYNIIILNISFYEQKINKEITKERYGIMPGTLWHYKYICNITKEKREKKRKEKEEEEKNKIINNANV